jgi:hypothetical protein
MIKIENSTNVKLNSIKKNRKKTSPQSFHLPSEGGEVSNISNIPSISSINSLLVLQEVQENYTNEKDVKHGYEMLNQLKKLQLSLVCGEVSEQSLHLLSNMMKDTKGRFTDPALIYILEEIELRVAIEISKLGKKV